MASSALPPSAGERAAEGAIGRGGIAGVAGRIDVVAQPARQRRIEHVAGFLESGKRVCVEHLGPQIAVVARRVAAFAGEHVLEVGRTVTQHDFVRHGHARARARLDGAGVGRRASVVEVEIDEGGGEVLGGHEALVEAARGDQARHQVLGHRRAAAMVEREAPKDLRPRQPVLVELGGKLDEISGHGGAGDHRVGHVREQRVERVTELVEQGAGVFEAQQGRLAGGGLGEVHHVDDERAHVAGELLAVA
jgi:hypothetical protein